MSAINRLGTARTGYEIVYEIPQFSCASLISKKMIEEIKNMSSVSVANQRLPVSPRVISATRD